MRISISGIISRIASSSSEVQHKTTKKPESVMVLCVMSSDVDVLTHFFNKKKKIIAIVYCKVLEEKIIS